MTIFILLAVVTGGCLTLSWLTNAALGNRIGSMPASFVNHCMGALFAAVLLAAGIRTGEFFVSGIPFHYFLGGCVGVIVVFVLNFSIQRIGAMSTTLIIVSFQLFCSALIDHVGILGAQQLPLTPQRFLGLLLLMLGAVIVLSKKSRLMKDQGGA